MSVSQPSNAADRDQIHFQSTTLANLSSHTSKNALMQQRFGKSSCAGLPKLSVLPSLRSFNPTETRTRSSQRSCSIAAASGVRFSKYQGLGNDFILVNTLSSSSLAWLLRPQLAKSKWLIPSHSSADRQQTRGRTSYNSGTSSAGL